MTAGPTVRRVSGSVVWGVIMETRLGQYQTASRTCFAKAVSMVTGKERVQAFSFFWFNFFFLGENEF